MYFAFFILLSVFLHGKQTDGLYICLASYVISVRRTKSLLTASFRFYLTIDTLAVQLYTSLSPRRVRDFHPLERAHGAQTYKKEPVGSFFHLPAHKQVLSEYLPKQLIGTPKYIIRCHDSLTSDWFDTCLLIFRQKNIHL